MIVFAAAALAVTLGITNDAVTAPTQIAAGLTTFTIENHATAPHALRFVKLSAPHTSDEFGAFLRSGGKPPAWISTVGGVATLAPSRSEDYTITIAAGSYVIVDGDRFVPLRVTGPAAKAQPPAADVNVRLRDHGFQLNAPLSSGKQTIHLQNVGSEPHQALIVRLPERVSEFAIRTWITNGSHGEHPGEPVGGALEVPIGAEAWVTLDLTPGRYILLCGQLEEEGRHFDLGMIYRFEIE